MTDEAAPPAVPPRQRTAPLAPVRLLAAIAALLLLGGCTTFQAEAPPATTSRSTTTAPPSPSMTAAPAYAPATADGPAQNVPTPVLPDEAKEFSKEGLEAFARHWYGTLGYAFETGNADPMMAISSRDCKPCASMEKSALGGHEEGRWIVGGQMYVLSADSTFKLMPDNTYQVVAMVRQQQVQYYRADKSLSKDLGVTTANADIVVANYADGQWKALTVEHLQGSKG